MQSKAFKITEEQIEKLRPYLPDIDELIQDYSRFEIRLDDAIIDELDENYELKLQRILQAFYKSSF